jgi:hypothetical protein
MRNPFRVRAPRLRLPRVKNPLRTAKRRVRAATSPRRAVKRVGRAAMGRKGWSLFRWLFGL